MNIDFSNFKINPHGIFLSVKCLNTVDYGQFQRYLVDTNEKISTFMTIILYLVQRTCIHPCNYTQLQESI